MMAVDKRGRSCIVSTFRALQWQTSCSWLIYSSTLGTGRRDKPAQALWAVACFRTHFTLSTAASEFLTAVDATPQISSFWATRTVRRRDVPSLNSSLGYEGQNSSGTSERQLINQFSSLWRAQSLSALCTRFAKRITSCHRRFGKSTIDFRQLPWPSSCQTQLPDLGPFIKYGVTPANCQRVPEALQGVSFVDTNSVKPFPLSDG